MGDRMAVYSFFMMWSGEGGADLFPHLCPEIGHDKMT